MIAMVEKKVEIPDFLKIFGEHCNADRSVDEHVHYFSHPDIEDMDRDIDIEVSVDGEVLAIVGDDIIESYDITGDNVDMHDILYSAVKVAEKESMKRGI